MTLNLRIDNKQTTTFDTVGLLLRYYYQDQGENLGTTLSLSENYVTIGHGGGQGKLTGHKVVTLTPAATGADHYLEFSFSGTLAAKGDTNQNDQFNVNVRLYNSSYQGKVDPANDYSFNAGETGYDEKITLVSSTDKLIWGTAPGGGGGGGGDVPTDPDAGAPDASAAH
jgi:hypothetical protein